MHWVYLYLAIALEISGTLALRRTEGLQRLDWFTLTIVLYVGSFAALGKTLNVIPVGVAYAIWSGLGTAVIVLFGVVVFRESLTLVRMMLILCIVGGAVGLNLTTPSKPAPPTAEP